MGLDTIRRVLIHFSIRPDRIGDITAAGVEEMNPISVVREFFG
jgi:hypothetical protein